MCQLVSDVARLTGRRVRIVVPGGTWANDTITAAELANHGGWPIAQGVIEVDLRTQAERTLGADESVTLKPDMGFGRSITWKRG